MDGQGGLPPLILFRESWSPPQLSQAFSALTASFQEIQNYDIKVFSPGAQKLGNSKRYEWPQCGSKQLAIDFTIRTVLNSS